MNSESNPILDNDSTPARDDYLWDRSGEVDPQVAHLESILSPMKHAADTVPAPLEPHRRRWVYLSIAAAVVLALGAWAIAWQFAGRESSFDGDAAWSVTSLAGSPSIGSSTVAGSGELKIGQALETDDQSQATVAVADIGHVTVKPNSRLRLVASGRDEHRLALDRGEIHALIFAAPRLFFVDTSAATAIDYGCEYTLVIDPAGDGMLSVNRGMVMLERDGREVVVTADSVCRMRSGVGPGTPCAENASEPLQTALEQFDFENGGDRSLNVVLNSATVLDTITLWHLLGRVDASKRGEVFDRLAEFVPPPDGVDRHGILQLDQRMIGLWKPRVQSRW